MCTALGKPHTSVALRLPTPRMTTMAATKGHRGEQGVIASYRAA